MTTSKTISSGRPLTGNVAHNSLLWIQGTRELYICAVRAQVEITHEAGKTVGVIVLYQLSHGRTVLPIALKELQLAARGPQLQHFPAVPAWYFAKGQTGQKI